MGIAKVTLLGNLTRDPETRHTPGGKAVTQFGVAVNRKLGNDQNGNPRESVMFIDVAIWGPRGEAFARFHRKGSLAFLVGDLELDKWTDKTSGQERSKHKVTAWEWEFCGGKRDDAGQPSEQSTPASALPGDDAFAPF